MERHFAIGLAVALFLGLGFASGYFYRHTHPPMQAEMEDYALANVLSEVGYAHYIAKGNLADARKIIDVNLNGHLSRILRYQGSATDETFMASKIRALNAVANLWDASPPSAGMDTDDWKAFAAKNRDLLQWAREQCAMNPSLKCASPNRTVEGDARKSATRPSQ
jgi:hypothetical protein